MRSAHRDRSLGLLAVAAVVLALIGVPALTPAPSPPSGVSLEPAGRTTPSNLSLERVLLSNLSAPSVGPGGSTTLSYRLYDPANFSALSHVVLSFAVYALNGYPGGAVGPVPVSAAPLLENGTASGLEVNVTLLSLAPGADHAGSLSVVTSGNTPAGTYAVRTRLAFVANSSAYLFESRGWFSESAWENATEGPGGIGTLNLSRLGVPGLSGVVPETAVYVAPSGWPVALGALVAVGVVLVGLGAWLYFRRGPGSRSGSGNDAPPGATNAPSAFGSSRSNPGDSRSS